MYINLEYSVSSIKRVSVYSHLLLYAFRGCGAGLPLFHKNLLVQTPVTYRDRNSSVEQTLIVARRSFTTVYR